MAMRKYMDAVVTTGEYTNQQGETKKRYLNVGVLLKDDQSGRMCLKLEAMPIPRDGACWIGFFEPRQQEQRPAPTPQAQPVAQPTQQPAQPMPPQQQGFTTQNSQGQDQVPF